MRLFSVGWGGEWREASQSQGLNSLLVSRFSSSFRVIKELLKAVRMLRGEFFKPCGVSQANADHVSDRHAIFVTKCIPLHGQKCQKIDNVIIVGPFNFCDIR